METRPSPVGAQTVQAAIERAFARSRGEQPTPKKAERAEPPAAKPRIGHNQPPEPMEQEQPPIDLRKRPQGPVADARSSDQSVDRPAVPPRQRQPPPAQQGQPGAAPVNPLPLNAPYREPPQRLDRQAKTEWHAAPESVRGAVHRLQHDFGRFYQRAKPDIDAMTELRPFYELARSHGTTLSRAVNNYWTMENKLRSDPLAGLDVIVHNLNLRTQDGHQITFRDICHYVATQSPQQLNEVRSRNVQGAHNLQINQLAQQISQVAEMQRRMYARQQYANRRRQMSRVVNRFAETHPRVDELGQTIIAELPASRYNLEVAYRRAELLHPTTATAGHPQAAQTRTAAPQTRTDRSIHGAPSGSASPTNGRSPPRRAGKERTLEDSITDAVRRVRGSL
jgi:hypothetical protein